MKLMKDQVVEYIRANVDQASARRAQDTLPNVVDLDRDKDLLASLGAGNMDDWRRRFDSTR